MALTRRRSGALTRWTRPAPRVDHSYGDPRLAALRAAAARGRWPEIRELLAAVTDPEDLTWLIEGLAVIGGVETWIPQAVEAEPGSALPLLVSGARHIEWAWEARTRMMAKYVSKEQFAVFHDRLRIAEEQLYAVAEREPDWAAPWYFLQISGRGLQVGQQIAERRFAATVRRAPGHLAAHRQQLQQVCAKWSGSHARMHAFARTAMLGAPEGSPLGELVAVAHLEEWLAEDDAAMGHLRRSEVIVALYEAAERSVHHPDHARVRDWTRGFNTFAMAFALAGEHDAAADLFAVLDGSVTEFPWMYLDGKDPAVPFRAWRSRVGA